MLLFLVLFEDAFIVAVLEQEPRVDYQPEDQQDHEAEFAVDDAEHVLEHARSFSHRVEFVPLNSLVFELGFLLHSDDNLLWS